MPQRVPTWVQPGEQVAEYLNKELNPGFHSKRHAVLGEMVCLIKELSSFI